MSDFTNHTRLTCHAPHPDPRRSDERCDRILVLSLPAVATFDRLEDRYPPARRDEISIQCARHGCHKVNVFKLEKTSAEIIARRT